MEDDFGTEEKQREWDKGRSRDRETNKDRNMNREREKERNSDKYSSNSSSRNSSHSSDDRKRRSENELENKLNKRIKPLEEQYFNSSATERSFYDLDWNNPKLRDLLNKTFFKASDYFPSTNQYDPEYVLFWGIKKYLSFETNVNVNAILDFLRKYIERKQKLLSNPSIKQENKKAEGEISDEESLKLSTSNNNSEIQSKDLPQSILNIPSTFDERYLINFSILTDEKTVLKEVGQILPIQNNKMSFPVLYIDPYTFLTESHLQEFRKVIHLYENYNQRKKFEKLFKIQRDRANLPIAKYKDQIINTIASNNIVIIAGDTGCGKSTQVVQYLLESGFNKIACTQPRRLAAIALCRRVAYETLNEFGSSIGYQIRFDSTKTKHTKILFLTEGLLLRQLATDPLLNKYEIIVIDEVHERHIFGDFLLGILKNLIVQRSNLKLILMSATINVDLFSNYFDNAPVILVPGRVYSIEVEYLPLEEDKKKDEIMSREELKELKEERRKDKNKKRLNPKPYLAIMQRIDQNFPPDERGDLLIFVSGMDEILALEEGIKPYASYTKKWIVLKLHSSLSVDEQDKVFDIAPEGVRKCILSTNIAETSVTIDGIRFCIDSGKLKEMSYDAECRMSKLQEFWISQASAEQRKGRAGRTGPGYCFRFYSKENYDQLEPYPVPEIQRIPLESIILQIKALGFGNPRQFNFIERPSLEKIEEAITTLIKHETLNNDADESLTPLGAILSQLPVDIAIGKILVLGTVFGILEPLLTICASLSVQSPLLRISSDANFNARNDFLSDHGDPFTLLNFYDEWIYIKAHSKENSNKWCRRHGLEEQRLYEISKLRSQFKELLIDAKLIKQNEQLNWGVNFYGHFIKRKSNSISYKKQKLRELEKERNQNRERRVLKLEVINLEGNGEEEEEAEEENEEIDLRDIEFRLSYSEKELLESTGRNLTRADINLLKLILISGLYPNIAIPDEFNSNHKETDQIYHTQFKAFVYMHPTSIYYGRSILIPISDLLCYEKLLETNKPYITNAFRAPSLHALLLFAKTVDTNNLCNRFIIDNWLELKVDSIRMGERILTIVNQLRLLLKRLLSQKLTSKMKVVIENSLTFQKETELHFTEDELQKFTPFIHSLVKVHFDKTMECTEEELSEKFSEYLEIQISYQLIRLKKSQVMTLFRGNVKTENTNELNNPIKQLEFNQIAQTNSFNEEKGGIKINEWLRFGSVLDEEEIPITAGFSEYMKKHFHCGICFKDYKFTLSEAEHHLKTCGKEDSNKNSNPSLSSPNSRTSPTPTGNAIKSTFQKDYYCGVCNKTLKFTPTEILLHKKFHDDMISEEQEEENKKEKGKEEIEEGKGAPDDFLDMNIKPQEDD